MSEFKNKMFGIVLTILMVAFSGYVVFMNFFGDSIYGRAITKIMHHDGYTTFELDDGLQYKIDFDENPYNLNNSIMLYEGIRIRIIKDHLYPLKQNNSRTLDEMAYFFLVAQGYPDEDIECYQKTPDGLLNPNRKEPNTGCPQIEVSQIY